MYKKKLSNFFLYIQYKIYYLRFLFHINNSSVRRPFIRRIQFGVHNVITYDFSTKYINISYFLYYRFYTK